MNSQILSTGFLIIALLPCAQMSNAATLSLDLDLNTPGIQTSRILSPGNNYEIGIVFTGDGLTNFDTFALDVVHDSNAIGVHTPLAGLIVDSAPMMALDIYGASAVSSGDPLTQGSMPIPLGYEGGLGGIGVSSVGGMAFPQLAQDESIGLFNTSLTALHGGTSVLALTGYPFGIDAELSLAGVHVPVTLQGASVTVVPIPPAIWLFACGILGLFGIGQCRVVRNKYCRVFKRVPYKWLLSAFALAFPVLSYSRADVNSDAIVTSQDISIVASCIGQDPASNIDCANADADDDGDIDVDDFSFVSARLGQAFPETLFSSQDYYRYLASSSPESIALGDVNNDAVPDVVTANELSSDISVLLGNGDGSFQEQQHFAIGPIPISIGLGDVNGDSKLDVVTSSGRDNDISVLLGNGDGSFQEQQRFATGSYPGSVALGDVNGDTLLDVVTANMFSNDISVLLSNGDGTFQAQRRLVTGSYPHSVVLGDVNGDTLLDVVLSDDCVSVFFGNGDGRFQARRCLVNDSYPGPVALGDVNSDMLLDIVALDAGILVLLGNGDGSFQVQQRIKVGVSLCSIALGDVNGDAVLDVVAANSIVGSPQDEETSNDYWNSIYASILLGNGDGTFQRQQRIGVGLFPRTVVLGDLNGDNALDMVSHIWIGDFITVILGNGK